MTDNDGADAPAAASVPTPPAGGRESHPDLGRANLVDKIKSQARKLDDIGHLGPEAVAAFVDGEMPAKAMHRVRIHIVHCAQCRADVQEQRGARTWVQTSCVEEELRAPLGLVDRLNQIAAEPVTPGPDGEISLQDPERDLLDKIVMIRRALRRG